MPASTTAVWEKDEAGLGDAFSELGRLGRRARRRLPIMLSFATLVALALCAWRATHQPRVWATSVLAVYEGDLDPTTAPRPKRELRRYVDEVVFSRQNLLAIVRARKLSSVQALAADPVL